jgi:Zn-dependent alcohol dehydrogenase
MMADGTPRFTLDGAPVHHLSGLGTFSELLVADETAVVPIDHDVPFDAAALIGCGVLTGVGAAVNTARIDPGDTVAVIGCGGVGLNVVQGAVLAGAERIIAIDRAPAKAKTAKAFGATDIVPAEADTEAAVAELTGGVGVDVAFEVVGVPATGRLAVDIVRPGGQACIVGMAPMDAMMSVPMASTFALNGKQIIGSSYGSANVMRDVPQLIEWWRGGRLRLSELISERIALPGLNTALDALESSNHLRTVVVY